VAEEERLCCGGMIAGGEERYLVSLDSYCDVTSSLITKSDVTHKLENLLSSNGPLLAQMISNYFHEHNFRGLNRISGLIFSKPNLRLIRPCLALHEHIIFCLYVLSSLHQPAGCVSPHEPS
jgi:hypothetical protein